MAQCSWLAFVRCVAVVCLTMTMGWPFSIIKTTVAFVDKSNSSTWLTIAQHDISPGDLYTNATNARHMSVITSRFNYTQNAPALKIKFRGNIGTPSPTLKQPLMVSVRNKLGSHTFTVPYAVLDKDGTVLAEEDTATRFLCPGPTDQLDYIVVSVGTGYLDAHDPTKKYQFNVELQLVGHWQLSLGAPEKLLAAPSEPAVFLFDWLGTGGGSATVLVSMDSISAPDVCVTLAIQQRTCPLALTPAELETDSQYVTGTRRAALTVRRRFFPRGFYVIVLPRVGDRPCEPTAAAAAAGSRKKTVEVTVTAERGRPAYLAVPPLLALLLLLLGLLGSRLLLSHHLQRARLDVTSPSPPPPPSDRRDSLVDSEDLLVQDDEEPAERQRRTAPVGLSAVSIVTGVALILLAFGGSAVLDGIRRQVDTGNMDACYRNELCTHSVGRVDSINHLLARLPYLGAGLGALCVVYVQKKLYRRVTLDGEIRIGVEHDFNLLTSVGLALLFQGILSGLYSVCPSPRIAHLDVTFVFFALTSLGVKLFQTRRGITTVGHYTPLVFTAALVMASFVKTAAGGVWYVWLAVSILHVTTTIFVSVQLYVLGTASASVSAMKHVWQQSHRVSESPNFKMNRASFVLVISTNVALVVACLAAKIDDFSHYVVLFFTLHSALYTVYYLLLKIVGAREVASRSAVFLLSFGMLLLCSAVVILIGFRTFSTALSAASSRLLNRACLGDSLLDLHDVWHQLAATALFCLTLGVTVLDDDQLVMPRMEIQYF